MDSGIINSVVPFGRYVKDALYDINKTQVWLCGQVGIKPDKLSLMLRGKFASEEREATIRAFLEKYKASVVA